MVARVPTSSRPPDELHDETLVEWFLSLKPAERLAELESRLAFFATSSRDGEPKLSQNQRAA